MALAGLAASVLPTLEAGFAVAAGLEGLFVVTFVAGCFELEVLVAGRAVAVLCLLVAGVAVEGREVVLLLDEAGRAVVVAGRLVADGFVVGRFVAALLCCAF